MSRRVASCLSLLMATEMRLSGVHVAWAHGIDDSNMARTVNTHRWKAAWVVFVWSDRGAQWATCTGLLWVSSRWLAFDGSEAGRTPSQQGPVHALVVPW